MDEPVDEIEALFPELPSKQAQERGGETQTPARVRMPNRQQMELRPSSLESLLAEGHRARLVWGYVERQDLSALYAKIKSREGGAGRSAIGPEILFALWLYATLEGVGSARELARLALEHDAYRWICGGVQVNYHTLSDFRIDHGEVLDELLSENVAGLMAAGVVKFKSVAQDGVRVRASAGAASFRREDKLKGYLDQARERVQSLKREVEADPGAVSRKAEAARARAAREREQRIEQALERLPEIRDTKQRQGKKPEDARASTTDAQASIMKMADGGFRPAYNTQYATDCETQVVVGVGVVTSGSDMGQLAPMVEQVQTRYGQAPEQWLVDGGYPKHDQIDAVADKTEVYAPVPEPKPKKAKADKDKGGQDKGGQDKGGQDKAGEVEAAAVDKHAPRDSDSRAVAEWRARMASDEAKEIYKDRAATAECVHAQARNRGLVLLPVRGLAKVKCVATLFALAHNLMRMVALAPELIGIATGPSEIAAAAE
jgi:transposase